MQIGDINIVESILNLERTVGLLTRVIQQIKEDNPDVVFPSLNLIEKFNEQSIQDLAKKYPNMDIKKK